MENPIINKVSQSKLVEIDPADFQFKGETIAFDISDLLFQGQILREKDIREFAKKHNWEQYREKRVAVFCAADAIVPVWAFMLIASVLAPFASGVYYGITADAERAYMEQQIENLDVEKYRDKKIVVKGCGETPINPGIYLLLAKKLQPVAASIMYGEPCSTVPIFKKRPA